MKKFTLLAITFLIASSSFAKIWRVNNNPGVVADFTNLPDAVNSSTVMDGDTLHLEPSATNYGNATINKRLVLIGPGYFLDPADATYGGNSGLQYNKDAAMLGYTQVAATGAGSKLMGITFFNNVLAIFPGASAMNLTVERCFFPAGGIYFYDDGAGNTNTDGLVVRKCFFYNILAISVNGTVPTASNFTMENCILYNSYVNLSQLTGTGNIVRNNSWYQSSSANNIANAYVANNIFDAENTTFTNATIKNNLFKTAQPLPGTATDNEVNVDMANAYTGGSGSLDSRVMLKAGSPAIGAGVTISGYTPNAGAFGATDPYKLSGIPAVPTIYSLTVPTSIPTGSNTMNITFSSRNNN